MLKRRQGPFWLEEILLDVFIGPPIAIAVALGVCAIVVWSWVVGASVIPVGVAVAIIGGRFLRSRRRARDRAMLAAQLVAAPDRPPSESGG